MANSLVDPRQIACLANYKDPNSETFGNLKQSAIRAGYSIDYADTLFVVKPDWLTENLVNDVQAVLKAEQNLRKVNDYKLEMKDVETKRDVELLKSQIDVSKFILKTQAKAKYNEEEVKTPPNVQVNIVNYNDDPTKAPIVEAHVVPITPSTEN